MTTHEEFATARAVWEARLGHEREQVRALGERIGYGNMMRLAQECWREHLTTSHGFVGGEHIVGPCAAQVVSCGCQGGCDWCAGCGWLTKHVKALKDKRKRR